MGWVKHDLHRNCSYEWNSRVASTCTERVSLWTAATEIHENSCLLEPVYRYLDTQPCLCEHILMPFMTDLFFFLPSLKWFTVTLTIYFVSDNNNNNNDAFVLSALLYIDTSSEWSYGSGRSNCSFSSCYELLLGVCIMHMVHSTHYRYYSLMT